MFTFRTFIILLFYCVNQTTCLFFFSFFLFCVCRCCYLLSIKSIVNIYFVCVYINDFVNWCYIFTKKRCFFSRLSRLSKSKLFRARQVKFTRAIDNSPWALLLNVLAKLNAIKLLKYTDWLTDDCITNRDNARKKSIECVIKSDWTLN